jgi:hypothetical protein
MLLVAIVNGLMGLMGKKEFVKKDKMINMITMALFHLQIVIGIVLYFVSGKVSFSSLFDDIIFRYFTLEHPAIMLLTAAIFTIGYRKVKKAEDSKTKFKRTFWWFLGTLALVMYAIPWAAVYGAKLV